MSKSYITAFLLFLSLTVSGQRFPLEITEKMDVAMKLVEISQDSAMDISWDAWRLAKRTSDLWVMGLVRGFLGYQGYRMGDIELSYMNNLSGLELFQKADTVDYYNMGILLGNLGLIHSDFDQYGDAIIYIEQSINYYQTYLKLNPEGSRVVESKWQLCELKYSLASAHVSLNEFDLALVILAELLAGIEHNEVHLNRSSIILEFGIIKMAQGELQAAIDYFMKVSNDNESDLEDIGIAYHNLGGAHLALNQLEEAEKWLRLELDLERKGWDKESIFMGHLDLGEVLFGQKRYVEAVDEWQKALGIFPSPRVGGLYDIYTWLEKGYRALGRDDLAETFGLLYLKYKEDYNNSVEVIKASDERDAFERLVNKLREDKLKRDIRRDYTLLIVVVVVIVVLLSVFIVVRIRKKRQKKLYQELGDILLEDNSNS